MADEGICPGCGSRVESRQDYCVECGSRLASPRRLLHWAWPAGAAALVAAAGAVAAIAAGGNTPGHATIVALTPLHASAKPAARARDGALISWPRRNGYTVVLSAVPLATGAEAARAQAKRAALAGLTEVGVLVSDSFASLHPGYAVVFSGVYDTLDEALAALPQAARRFRNAYTQRIVR